MNRYETESEKVERLRIDKEVSDYKKNQEKREYELYLALKNRFEDRQ